MNTLVPGQESQENDLSQRVINLLLVEDQPDYALLLRRWLARTSIASFFVQHAPTLAEAQAELARTKFGVIVLDLILPDSEGLQTLDSVRSAAPATPVVVLSGMEDEENALKAVQSGAQDYLVKDKVSVELLERSILYAIERKRSQDELLQEQHLLLTLMENVPDKIYFKDLASRFTRVNRSVAAGFGLLNPAEAIGKTDADFFDQTHALQARADEQQVIATGAPIVNQEELESWPDGKESWVSTTKMPLRDAQGLIVGTFGISRDITALKQAEAAVRQLNEQLEQRVLERTNQLSSANRKLENEIQERQRTEDELRASNTRATAIFENALDAMIISDSAGRYLDVNPAACALLGKTREELIGSFMGHLVTVEQRDALAEMTSALFRDGVVRGELRIKLPDEQFKDVEFTARADFVPGQHLTVMRDVTERRKSEQERALNLERQQRQAKDLASLANASLAINAAVARPGLFQVITDQARDLIETNVAVTALVAAEGNAQPTNAVALAEKYLDAPEQALIAVGQVALARVMSAAGAIQLSHADLAGETASDDNASCGGMAAPMIGRDGRVLGAICVVGKISGPFGDEDSAMLAQLAQVATIAIENSRLYRATQDAVRAREEVLAIVSHDLKNPLGAIQGYTQMINRRVTQTGASEDRMLNRSLSQIESAAKRMGKQIDELLDFAKLQVGQPLELAREPVDLVLLCSRLASEHGRTTSLHVIKVETALESLVGFWDAGRIERVIDNLLTNAIKYSPKSGEIVIRLDQQEDKDSACAVLAVSDLGLGIPAADLGRVFERFHRASNVAGWIPGTGIGLASTKHIIEEHGGAISVSSEEGAGTTFTVRLPLT